MTLTVRHAPALAAALERHCAERGATKSLVVQESLAAYLLANGSSSAGLARAGASPASATQRTSARYRAPVNAGLLGSLAGDGVPATQAVVRERIARRLGRRAAGPAGPGGA
jgi:hypothetical protein